MKRDFYPTEKRIEKISQEQQMELIFDLINAISLVRDPLETALFLEDLLTAAEVKNLARRLRIAKLLISGRTQREIAQELHCSFATVAKVNLWLKQKGEGFKKIINKLPKKYELPKLPPRPMTYHLPETLITLAGFVLANGQNKQLKSFINSMGDKAITDKGFQEAVNEYYQKK